MEETQPLPMSEFRRQVGEYINQTYYAGKAFTLTKGDKKVAAIVPMAVLEELANLREFHRATLDAQAKPVESASTVE